MKPIRRRRLNTAQRLHLLILVSAKAMTLPGATILAPCLPMTSLSMFSQKCKGFSKSQQTGWLLIKNSKNRHFDFGRRKVGLCSGETSTFLRGKSQFAPSTLEDVF